MPRSPDDVYSDRLYASDRRIHRRLKENTRKREDARLKAIVIQKQTELGWLNQRMARAIGMPPSTYNKWRSGDLLPSKYIPLIEPTLVEIASGTLRGVAL